CRKDSASSTKSPRVRRVRRRQACSRSSEASADRISSPASAGLFFRLFVGWREGSASGVWFWWGGCGGDRDAGDGQVVAAIYGSACGWFGCCWRDGSVAGDGRVLASIDAATVGRAPPRPAGLLRECPPASACGGSLLLDFAAKTRQPRRGSACGWWGSCCGWWRLRRGTLCDES